MNKVWTESSTVRNYEHYHSLLRQKGASPALCWKQYYLLFNMQISHSPPDYKPNKLHTNSCRRRKSLLGVQMKWNLFGDIIFPLSLFTSLHVSHSSLSLSLFPSPSSSSSSRSLFPALCWLARLQSWGTPEIQISWHLFGRTRQAAYASQVMCIQTCNLQIINVVLISHINSCHFVGIVSPR